MTLHLRIVSAASVVALTWAGAAVADSPNIQGSYGFTGSAECLIAPGHAGDPNGPPMTNPTPGVALPNSGFQADLRPNDAVSGSRTQAFANSFAVEGIRKFNGDGTGTVMGVDPRPTPGPGGFPHFPPSAGSSDFSFSFTYTVNSDGTWTGTMTPGSYTETI
jgi:hypothetical protein